MNKFVVALPRPCHWEREDVLNPLIILLSDPILWKRLAKRKRLSKGSRQTDAKRAGKNINTTARVGHQPLKIHHCQYVKCQ